MIHFDPSQRPAERVRWITEAARASAALPSVRALATEICGEEWSPTDAYALLAAVQRPTWKGDTERDPLRGQWIDTNVSQVVLRGGDCVARSFALVSLLTSRGFDARAVWCRWRDAPDDELDHCIVSLTRMLGPVYGDPSGTASWLPLPETVIPLA